MWKEDDRAGESTDDAVNDEILHSAIWQDCGEPAPDMPEDQFDEVHRNARELKDGPEHAAHDG